MFCNLVCCHTINRIAVDMGCGVQRNFQQYFIYIGAICFTSGETRVPGENHRPVANH